MVRFQAIAADRFDLEDRNCYKTSSTTLEKRGAAGVSERHYMHPCGSRFFSVLAIDGVLC